MSIKLYCTNNHVVENKSDLISFTEKVPPACFGGVARLFNTVKEIKADEENVIFLNGGDMFQGNVWYSQFKWRVIAQFTNYLNFTASVSIFEKKGIGSNSIIKSSKIKE